MNNLEAPLVIFVDVDDTFVRSFGTKRIPIPAAIARIRQLHEHGAELYCWSSGGAEYARSSAEEFGIADCFIAYLPKPQVVLDDQTFSEWRYLIQVHPASGDSRTVEEYRQELRRPRF